MTLESIFCSAPFESQNTSKGRGQFYHHNIHKANIVMLDLTPYFHSFQSIVQCSMVDAVFYVSRERRLRPSSEETSNKATVDTQTKHSFVFPLVSCRDCRVFAGESIANAIANQAINLLVVL